MTRESGRSSGFSRPAASGNRLEAGRDSVASPKGPPAPLRARPRRQGSGPGGELTGAACTTDPRASARAAGGASAGARTGARAGQGEREAQKVPDTAPAEAAVCQPGPSGLQPPTGEGKEAGVPVSRTNPLQWKRTLAVEALAEAGQKAEFWLAFLQWQKWFRPQVFRV